MERIQLAYDGDYNVSLAMLKRFRNKIKYFFQIHQSLVYAIDQGDINTFRNALNSMSEVEKCRIFEKACKKPGRAQFIKACISAGCDVNKVCVFIILTIEQSFCLNIFFEIIFFYQREKKTFSFHFSDKPRA